MLGINSERPGGVTNALKALNYAKQRGLGVVVHNQPLGIASSMHIHFTAANYHSIDFVYSHQVGFGCPYHDLILSN